MTTWISSDLHLGHKGIVRGTSEWIDKSECRDFNTLEEHDDTILYNINKNVKNGDHLYLLGDFSFGGIENVAFYREKIICENIHYIMGNHDHHIRKNKIVKYKDGYINLQNLFLSCDELLDTKIGKNKYVMCHYPVFTRHVKRDSPFILYGHFHTSQIENYCNNSPSMNVGIDTHPEFRPYHINEIVSILKNQI